MLVQGLDASALSQENSFSDMYHPSGRYIFLRLSLGNQHGPVYQGRIPGMKFIHMDEELFVHLTSVGGMQGTFDSSEERTGSADGAW